LKFKEAISIKVKVTYLLFNYISIFCIEGGVWLNFVSFGICYDILTSIIIYLNLYFSDV